MALGFVCVRWYSHHRNIMEGLLESVKFIVARRSGSEGW